MASVVERIYSVDTSALVWVQRNISKTGVFADVWLAFGEIISAGRAFSPDIVLAEIERGSDDLAAWCRQFKSMFRGPIDDVANIVGRLGGEHPGFVESLKPDDEADPWVVAWALYENDRLSGELFGGECFVVSSEGTKNNHIPDVCRAEKITCVTFQEMLALEGLKFARK